MRSFIEVRSRPALGLVIAFAVTLLFGVNPTPATAQSASQPLGPSGPLKYAGAGGLMTFPPQRLYSQRLSTSAASSPGRELFRAGRVDRDRSP